MDQSVLPIPTHQINTLLASNYPPINNIYPQFIFVPVPILSFSQSLTQSKRKSHLDFPNSIITSNTNKNNSHVHLDSHRRISIPTKTSLPTVSQYQSPLNVLPQYSTSLPLISSNHTTPTISQSQSPLNVLQTNNKYNNISHINAKQISNKYKCIKCSKTFKHQTNLKIHSKIHTSEAFVCPFCEKRFARKTNMKQHLRVHTGEKPFKCHICEKACKQKHSLLDHVNTHTGERPHKCEYCTKAFTSRCNYTVHKRIHTGEKPYQ
eukprot:527464_1